MENRVEFGAFIILWKSGFPKLFLADFFRKSLSSGWVSVWILQCSLLYAIGIQVLQCSAVLRLPITGFLRCSFVLFFFFFLVGLHKQFYSALSRHIGFPQIVDLCYGLYVARCIWRTDFFFLFISWLLTYFSWIPSWICLSDRLLFLLESQFPDFFCIDHTVWNLSVDINSCLK